MDRLLTVRELAERLGISPALLSGSAKAACRLSASASGVSDSARVMSSNCWISLETPMPIQKELHDCIVRGLNDSNRVREPKRCRAPVLLVAICVRGEFQKMMLHASQRKFSLLLFWSLDRLTREGTLATLQYLERLTSYQVGYKSFTEPYLDSCGTFKDVVISLLATMAKQERLRMGERVRAGIDSSPEAKGQRLGRPPRCEC